MQRPTNETVLMIVGRPARGKPLVLDMEGRARGRGRLQASVRERTHPSHQKMEKKAYRS